MYDLKRIFRDRIRPGVADGEVQAAWRAYIIANHQLATVALEGFDDFGADGVKGFLAAVVADAERHLNPPANSDAPQNPPGA